MGLLRRPQTFFSQKYPPDNFKEIEGGIFVRLPQKKGFTPFLRFASRPVSRVLSFKTAIYLDAPLPTRSSRLPGTVGPTCCPSTALLRIEFTAMGCSQPSGELLPHLSTLTGGRSSPAVYLCCTFPRGAPGGWYPLSLPCGARTFLTHGPFAPRARLSSLLARL